MTLAEARRASYTRMRSVSALRLVAQTLLEHGDINDCLRGAEFAAKADRLERRYSPGSLAYSRHKRLP